MRRLRQIGMPVIICALSVFFLLPIARLFSKWIPQITYLCFSQWISWNLPESNIFSDAIYAGTALVILAYTVVTWLTFRQIRTSQNLNTLASLTTYYDRMRAVRSKIFKNREVTESDATALSNFLDGFGHITIRLHHDDQDIVIERWAETFVRCWIRLSRFVYDKRPHSIGRDYCFFEWLASKGFDFHTKYFSGQNILFFEFGDQGFSDKEIWEYYKEKRERGFKLKEGKEKVAFLKPKEVEKKFIEKRKRNLRKK
jgi:hypothetical protein